MAAAAAETSKQPDEKVYKKAKPDTSSRCQTVYNDDRDKKTIEEESKECIIGLVDSSERGSMSGTEIKSSVNDEIKMYTNLRLERKLTVGTQKALARSLEMFRCVVSRFDEFVQQLLESKELEVVETPKFLTAAAAK